MVTLPFHSRVRFETNLVNLHLLLPSPSIPPFSFLPRKLSTLRYRHLSVAAPLGCTSPGVWIERKRRCVQLAKNINQCAADPVWGRRIETSRQKPGDYYLLYLRTVGHKDYAQALGL